MKSIALMYHDACAEGDFDASGFTGTGTAIYKMEIGDMRRHFAAIDAVWQDKPANIYNFRDGSASSESPLFITFDDGGVSSATHIADMLDNLGWVGHFFVTASLIDSPGFLSTAQLRELDQRGHIVGSHSWSHPTRMSYCSNAELKEEWTRSIDRLEEILGKPVSVASVPFGILQDQIRDGDTATLKVMYNVAKVIAGRLAAINDKLSEIRNGAVEVRSEELRDFQKKLFSDWTF